MNTLIFPDRQIVARVASVKISQLREACYNDEHMRQNCSFSHIARWIRAFRNPQYVIFIPKTDTLCEKSMHGSPAFAPLAYHSFKSEYHPLTDIISLSIYYFNLWICN